jgi:hypothetical protein
MIIKKAMKAIEIPFPNDNPNLHELYNNLNVNPDNIIPIV